MPTASPDEDFANKLLRKPHLLGKGRDKKPASKPAGDSDDEYRPRVKEVEKIKVPSWPKVDTFGPRS